MEEVSGLADRIRTMRIDARDGGRAPEARPEEELEV